MMVDIDLDTWRDSK